MNNDLLYPIGDKNRSEHMLVQYETFIKNITEGMILTILKSKDDAILNFPNIEKYLTLNKEDLYFSTALYTPEEFMSIIAPEDISEKDLWTMVDIFLKDDNILEQQKTLFEYALYQLGLESFMKDITIIKKRPFLDYEIDHISKLFHEIIHKVYIKSGDIVDEVVNGDIQYTTVAINDIDDLIKIFDSMEEKELAEMMFIVNSTIHNCEITTGSNIKYLGADIINNHPAKNKNVTRMFPFIITEGDQPIF